MNKHSDLGGNMGIDTQETWKLALTRDEMIALARAMKLYIGLFSHNEESDKATTYLNLCRVAAKMPEEEWFDGEVAR